MTNRQIVSDIRGSHRLLDSDGRINDRTILNMARGISYVLINQRTNKRQLWNTDTIFTPIDCLEMEEVPLGTCCEYRGPATVARSKEKLPPIADGQFKYVIKGVYSASLTKDIKHADISRYINILKLDLKTNDAYYWIHNGHLFISSPYAKAATVIAQFIGEIPYNLMYPDCDCEGGNKNPCTSRLDEEFKCPASLLDTIKSMVSQKLLQSYFNVPEDKTSDNKDDQTRNKV